MNDNDICNEQLFAAFHNLNKDYLKLGYILCILEPFLDNDNIVLDDDEDDVLRMIMIAFEEAKNDPQFKELFGQIK